MLRYYLDSNIFRLIMQKHPNQSLDLLNAVDKLKHKALFIFSDAHLDDLKPSKNPFREEDLRFMGEYVQDNYFAVDIYLKLQLWLAEPLLAFNGKDYQAVDDFYADPYKILDLFQSLGDIPEARLLKNLMNGFLERPLKSVGNAPTLEEMDEGTRQWLQKYLPEYSPVMTFKEFMQSNLSFSISFKDNKNDLSELRKFIAKSINRNEYSWDRWKSDFNEKFKNTNFNKTFLECIDTMLVGNQRNSLYHQLIYSYTLLELYNVTEERTSNKLKKFTFTSLNQDAQHTFFASHCDFLVTDDRGMQLKAYIVFELFNIKTKVLTVDEFVNHAEIMQSNEETYESFITRLKYDLKQAFQEFITEDTTSEKVVRVYETTHFYFNYFNRIQHVSEVELNYIVFHCERSLSANFIMFREQEMLVNKLIKTFGQDDQGKGVYQFNEENGGKFYRRWTIEKVVYELMANNEYLCLYLTVA